MAIHVRGRGAKWVWIGGAVVVLAIVAIIAMTAFDGLSDSRITVERSATTYPDALALDEARTRAEAPALARLLDDAAADGYAETADPREVRTIRDFLDRFQRPGGSAPAYVWDGQTYLILHVGS